jgi:3-oxoacyl-[acyl-carrier protein] reductase
MKDLKDKVALVTGGARDIGRAISLELARQGAFVSVNYFDSPRDAEQTVAMICSEAGRAIAIPADVTKAAQVDAMVQKTIAAFGKDIHVLVNCAGGLVGRKRMEEMDEAFWDSVIELNLKSVFLVTRTALPFMPDGSSIVNIASQAGRDGGGGGAIAYAAAKGGIMTMTRGLAKELAARKIRVNCVCPGMINTTFHNVFTKPEVRQKVAAMTPLGREGEAHEVADLIAYLASGRSSYVNGTNIDINGGFLFS